LARDEKGVGGHQSLKAIARDGLESCLDFGIVTGIPDLNMQIGRVRRLLQFLNCPVAAEKLD
jgi:hypothetical protein